MTRSDLSSRRRNWRPIAVAIFVVVIYFFATRTPGLPAGWSNDFPAALRQASVANQKLLVAFAMEGCPPCRMMERSVLPDFAVKEALRDYVPVHVDAAAHPELADRMGIVGTPTYVITASDGTPLLSVSGYLPVDSFVAFLKEGAKAEKPVTISNPPLDSVRPAPDHETPNQVPTPPAP